MQQGEKKRRYAVKCMHRNPSQARLKSCACEKKEAYEQEDQRIRSIDIQTHPSLQPLCSLPFSLGVARAGDHLPQHAPDDFSA